MSADSPAADVSAVRQHQGRRAAVHLSSQQNLSADRAARPAAPHHCKTVTTTRRNVRIDSIRKHRGYRSVSTDFPQLDLCFPVPSVYSSSCSRNEPLEVSGTVSVRARSEPSICQQQ